MQSSSKAEPQESPGQLKKKLWPAIKKLVKVFLPLSAQQWLWRTKRRYLPAFGESTAQRNHLRAGAWDAEPLPGARFDVVCFSVIDWDFRFQRPQQLMTSLAEAGHRVFYLSQHFRGAGQPFQLKKIRENLYEVSLRGPAINPYTGKLNQAGLARLQSSLNALRRELGLGATLSVVQLPFWWPLAQALRQECAWPVLYDCMDFHAGFSTNRSRMLQIEEDLLKGADHVVVTSLYLQEQVRPFNDRVSLIRNACDYEHFAQVEDKTPAQRPPTQRPQIGYYGAIADWFDSDLMADLAQRRPDWDFLLVGATATADLKRLSRLPNVQLLGEQPYASLPDWLRRMDVLLIPFKRLPLTEATNPVKAYDSGRRRLPWMCRRAP